MSKFIGRQQAIAVSVEATRGTLVAPESWINKTNYSVEPKVQKGRFEGNYGNIYPGDDAIVTQKWAEGDIEFEIQDQMIGYFLYALFGGLSSAAFQSVLKHTLTIAGTSVQHKSLSLFMNDPIGSDNSKTIAYARAMINSMELTIEPGELVKAVANFQAMPHTDYTRQTASFTAENKFSHKDLTFKVAANEAGLDAASKINLQSFTLNINKNVIRENALGTVQPVDILNRLITIQGTIMLTYEDRVYRDYMLDGTKKAIRITLQKADTTIGTTNPTIQIDLPVVEFDSWEPNNPNDDISTQEIQFTALYDPTNDELIGTNTFVVNEKASY